jgi:hypothetical protein
VAELEEIMRGVDYRRFQDGPRWTGVFAGKAAALMFQQGIYEGQFARDWLGGRLARLGVHTFADLPYDDPQRPPDPERAYRLVVMACDISYGCLRRLPWEYGHYGLPAPGSRWSMPSARRCPYRFCTSRPADWRRRQGLLAGRRRDAVPLPHRRVRRPAGSAAALADVRHPAGRITRADQPGARHQDPVMPARDALRSLRRRLHRHAQNGDRATTS